MTARVFFADELPEGFEFLISAGMAKKVLSKSVVKWLSTHLRKRKGAKHRRYDYILSGAENRIGVLIYSDDDIMVFKLTWL